NVDRPVKRPLRVSPHVDSPRNTALKVSSDAHSYTYRSTENHKEALPPMQPRNLDEYNTPQPVSWSRAWQTDPLNGDLSEEWPRLIESFRSRTPLGSEAPACRGELLGGGEL